MFTAGHAALGLAQTSAQNLDHLVSGFVEQELAFDPTLAYSTGLPINDHSRFADRSPKALAAFDAKERADLQQLRAIDPQTLPSASRPHYAILKEQLEADLQMRVCKSELWNVNHFDGWIDSFTQVAQQQPVATADERAQALKRWASVPAFVDVEIANLKRGLALGYSAPQSVVGRVIAQLDALIAATPEKSAFYSPAERATEPHFREDFSKVLTGRIDPALQRYRDFLHTEYLPKARTGVAISDLPHGEECYAALLRANTTLTRSPREVFDLGQKTVAANTADVVRLAHELFGIDDTDVARIARVVKSKPENHFQAKDELLAFSRQVLAEARAKTAARLIHPMPRQDVVIVPEPDFQEAAGVSSHFLVEPDLSKPATFMIQLGDWRAQTRGEAEITTIHEAWPGHALQKSVARELQGSSPLSQLIDNPAYSEGWARYAEGLAEEAGLYTNDALILRRVWPARGMVVDPGLHALHWTRQQAIDYLVSSGRFDAKSADDTVDRIAVMPGQLTSYDSGGLEIKALRQQAQARLGPRFDLRQFNHVILEEGVVPLGELRRHVEEWLAKTSGKP